MPSVMMHYKAILEYFRLFHATTFSHLAQESSQEVGRQWGGQSQAVNFISQQLLFAHNFVIQICCGRPEYSQNLFSQKKIFFYYLSLNLKMNVSSLSFPQDRTMSLLEQFCAYILYQDEFVPSDQQTCHSILV